MAALSIQRECYVLPPAPSAGKHDAAATPVATSPSAAAEHRTEAARPVWKAAVERVAACTATAVRRRCWAARKDSAGPLRAVPVAAAARNGTAVAIIVAVRIAACMVMVMLGTGCRYVEI